MSDATNAAPAANDTPLSIRDAVGLLSTKEPEANNEAATAPEQGAPEQESPQGENASPETPPVPDETEGNADPADEPSIEPPRSWSKEHKDAFKALPAHLQQMVADSERAREADFLRRTNEAAEKSKAAQAKEQAAEQARQQYESQLPQLQQLIEQQIAGEFSDIKSWDDVKQLAANDPVRYMQWDAAQKRLASVQVEAQQAQARQQQEQQKQWADFVAQEDRAFAEKVPEWADPQKAAKLTADARSFLTELGFSESELADMWSGKQGISIRDHRLQLMMLEGVRHRNAKAQLKAAPPKPVPPVQRPGSPQNKGEAAAENLRALDERLSKSGNIRDAVALLNARQRVSK